MKKLERRTFLRWGATGLAASVSGCAPVILSETGPAKSEASEDPDPASIGSMTPEPGDLVDPSSVPAESWQEPWVWRPENWPDSQLDLNVVENQNPGSSPSPGNPAPSLFSYNGTSPAPTIRVKSDGVLQIKVRNTLGLNMQETPVGPNPDPADITPARRREVCVLAQEQIGDGVPDDPDTCIPFFYPEQLFQVYQPELRPGWSLKGHMNGQHAAHVTNLHTHGLHVEPETNPDGTHSDNVLLRILPQADWEARLQSADSALHTLGENEHVGELGYKLEFPFMRNGVAMNHPPGTHWYHPHSHGATNDQVASGMAGFLIVEGDVDEAINTAMTTESWPDPAIPAGPFDYRERLLFVQRVFLQSFDLDAGQRRNQLRFPPLIAVNGVMPASVMIMRPGAVERWRILNGSTDGAGTKRFMVLRGQYVHKDQQLWRVLTTGEGENAERRLEKVTQQDLEDAKLPIHQLSFDGITLVTEKNGRAQHTIKDLSRQNEGTQNPLALPGEAGDDEMHAMLRAF